jgi:colanic acid biosynthesis glycosyl transferase WcaI
MSVSFSTAISVDDALPYSKKRAPSCRKIFIHGMNFAPEPIGIGRYTGELAAYLTAQSESVEVVTSVPHYPGWKIRSPYRPWRYVVENRYGIKVIRCPLILHPSGRGIWRLMAPLSFAIAAAPVVVWRILRSHPHVVVCVEPTLFSAPAAVLAAKIIRARCILHVQDLEIDAAFDVGHLKGNWLRNLASAFERFFLRRFDLIITISERMKQKLIAKKVSSSSVTVLRNWVDTSKIKRLDDRNSFRDQLGIATKDFVVLYSGQIGPKQALQLLLEAALKCGTESGIQFVVAGDGPTKKSLVESYSHVPNIHFLPLQLEEKLCELLNLADLHVITQDRSAVDLGLPSKLGGMLASGRSVLVTADLDTELYDLLFGIAIIVPPGDVQALAEAIKSASRQRSNPPAEAAKLLEQFSSRTILPAFHQAFVETKRLDSVYEPVRSQHLPAG